MKNLFYLLSIIIIPLIVSSCEKEKENHSKPPFEINNGAKIPEFDADYAYEQIEKQISFGPRNPDSQGHNEALNYLNNELRKYTDDVILQSFSHSGYDNKELGLTNIIAKFNPEYKKRIILCAHWDTRPRAEYDQVKSKQNEPILGANDGASGVGILLELARLLKHNKISYGVDLVFLDGEDYGKPNDLDYYSLGAKYFSANLRNGYQPQFAILLDMVGDKDAYFPVEGNSHQYAPDIVKMIWTLAEQIGADKFVNKDDEAIYDDHIALNEAGIRTADIIDLELIGADTPMERRNYWHTQNDVMKNIGKDTLKQVGEVITKLLWSLNFDIK